MIFAATATQNIGVAVAVIAVLAWLAYVLAGSASARKEVGSEVELAPNRKPYFSDDELEGRKLDRALIAGLGALVIIGVGLPLYWLAEPGRQSGAEVNFSAIAVGRGHTTYLPATEGPTSFGCQTCHGPEGTGGSALFVLEDPETGDFRQVTWQAPALDTVLLRFSPEEVADIITFGRPGTPMPAWGVPGGGPMNEQQISDLVAYLDSIQIDAKEASAQVREDAEAAVGRGDYATLGEALFAGMCARCHTPGAAYDEAGRPGGGAFGPSLVDGATLRQFPLGADHLEFIREGSVANQSYGQRGIGSGRMPGFARYLDDDLIQAIVDYERSL